MLERGKQKYRSGVTVDQYRVLGTTTQDNSLQRPQGLSQTLYRVPYESHYIHISKQSYVPIGAQRVRTEGSSSPPRGHRPSHLAHLALID